MPIYAYKCASCGYAKDALQKLSDPPLTVCPQCGQPTFHKQVTAAGFQLKGTGWYVTDFRNGSGGGFSGAHGDEGGKAESTPEGKGEAKTEAKAKADTPPSEAKASPKSEAGGGASSSATSSSSPSSSAASPSGGAAAGD